MAKKQKSDLSETLSTIIWAVGIALILRTFLFQPFHIPSGSMLPGLMKGDYIITSKYSVGYGRYAAAPLPFLGKEGRIFEREPERGDVLVFRPDGDNKNFIKRLVGLPGDKLQMQQGRLFINGERVELERQGEDSFVDRFDNDVLAEIWRETFPEGNSHIIYDSQKNSPSDKTSVFTVPAGHYFMMGDNRDASADSRVPVRNGGAGNIPASNIIGRAEIVLLSVDNDFVLYKPWTWANMRGDRFFKRIK